MADSKASGGFLPSSQPISFVRLPALRETDDSSSQATTAVAYQLGTSTLPIVAICSPLLAFNIGHGVTVTAAGARNA